jgi:hypothetical protein
VAIGLLGGFDFESGVDFVGEFPNPGVKTYRPRYNETV